MLVVGVGQSSRVGKDTFSDMLAAELRGLVGWVYRDAFADRLKAHCREAYTWAGLRDRHYYNRRPEERTVVLPALGKTPVEVWVEVGNALRGVYSDTWVDLLFASYGPHANLVISDVRFPNEAKSILDRGGYLVKVTRPSVTVKHGSDEMIPEDSTIWDYRAANDGSLDRLRAQAKRIAKDIVRRRSEP